jgi:hypothetical protein
VFASLDYYPFPDSSKLISCGILTKNKIPPPAPGGITSMLLDGFGILSQESQVVKGGSLMTLPLEFGSGSIISDFPEAYPYPSVSFHFQ